MQQLAQSPPSAGMKAQSMRAALVVQRGDGWQTTYTLEGGRSVMIGRSSNCGLQLAGTNLAAIHCMLRLQDGNLLLQDWFSSTGTKIDGKPAIGEVAIPPGALIQVGDYVIRAELQCLEPETKAPAATASPIRTVVAADHEQHSGDSNRQNPSQHEPRQHEQSAVWQKKVDALVAENQTLRQQVTDLLNQSTQQSAGDGDVFAQETIDLLRAEIERLQGELLHREQVVEELPPLAAPNEFDSSVQLIERVDELLDELQHSDQRIAVLEELLRASEEATAAEREERHQLEAWVGDIEQRVGDRESDWKAEVDSLQGRLAEATDHQRRLEQRLAATASASTDDQRAREQIEHWKSRTAELQDQLDQHRQRCQALDEQVRKFEQQRTDQGECKQLENSLREERVRIAQERAELARSRAEVASMRAQLEQQATAGESTDREGDTRMRAFREHLREIHDREQAELTRVGLSGRLAKLWKRLEG